MLVFSNCLTLAAYLAESGTFALIEVPLISAIHRSDLGQNLLRLLQG